MKKIIIFMSILVFTIFFITKIEASSTVYKINPNSNTLGGVFKKYSTYNANTKHYYLIRSYLEGLEKKKGGTLILQKGTYTITNVLYVPSNVTIKMENGVILKKGTTTNSKGITAAKSMFQLISPSKSGKNGIVGGYNGEKNINFVGVGTVKIDMSNMKDSIAIIAGHNQNVKIENIQFLNMHSGHFIELDASKNVTIRNNKFLNSKATKENMKEAINLDTPDKLTEGWSQKWSKFDKTPNDTVWIENNHFQNIDVAIGTHNYSENKYHNKVTVRNNIIDKMRTEGIRVMNWSNAVIENNVIKNVINPNGRGILVSGAQNPEIKNNKFQNVNRGIQFIVWKNDGKAKGYKTTYNKLTASDIALLETNTIERGNEGHIRFNTILNDYKNKTQEYSLQVISLKTKPLFRYVSLSGAHAYKSNNKNSGVYRSYKPPIYLYLYPQGNNWYYALVKQNGKNVKYYFHEDHVQEARPSVIKTFYISEGGAKVYKGNSKTSQVIKTFNEGTRMSLYYDWSEWYFRYENVNGKATKVYLHEDNVQIEQPFMPKQQYVSIGGAPMYKEQNKTKGSYGTKSGVEIVEIQNLGNNWYYGYEIIGGQKTKVFYHEDNVQLARPNVIKTVYVSKGGAQVYIDKDKNAEVFQTINEGRRMAIYYDWSEWYYKYEYVNGKATKVYLHENNIQEDNPFQ